MFDDPDLQPFTVLEPIALSVILVVAGLTILLSLIQDGRLDLMLLSGHAAFFIAIYRARQLPDKLARTLDQAQVRGTLGPCPTYARRFATATSTGGRVAELLVSAALGAGMVLLARDTAHTNSDLALTLGFEGVIAGRHLGRIIYWSVGWYSARVLRFALIPDHPDGVGGLAPLGEYCLSQAFVIGIAGIHLAAWWLLIPYAFRDLYGHWAWAYGCLLGVAILAEGIVLGVPLWWFHRQMLQQKEQLMRIIDSLTCRAVSEPKAHSLWPFEVENIAKPFQIIDSLPTFPVKPAIARRFELQRLVLVVAPLVGNLAADSALKPWAEAISKAVEAWVK